MIPTADASSIRRNTVLLALSMALAFAAFQHLPSLGSLIAARMTGDASGAGVPMVVGILALACATYPAGRLMDRAGRRPVLIVGHLLSLLGSIGLGLSVLLGSYLSALLGFAAVGAGIGIGLLGRLGVADMYGPARRGQALGYSLAGITAGAIGGPLLLRLTAELAEAHGVDPLAAPWFTAALLCVGGAVAVWLVHPDPRDIAAALGKVSPPPAFQPGAVAGNAIAAATTTTALVQSAMVAMMTVVPLALVRMGGDLGLASILMLTHFVGMYGLSIPIGRVADLVGRRRVLAAGGGVTLAGAALAGVSGPSLPLFVALFLVGVGWSCSYLAGTALISDVAGPADRGRLLGRYDLLAWLAAAGATLTAGPLLAGFGLAGVAAVCGALALAAMAAAVWPA